MHQPPDRFFSSPAAYIMPKNSASENQLKLCGEVEDSGTEVGKIAHQKTKPLPSVLFTLGIPIKPICLGQALEYSKFVFQSCDLLFVLMLSVLSSPHLAVQLQAPPPPPHALGRLRRERRLLRRLRGQLPREQRSLQWLRGQLPRVSRDYPCPSDVVGRLRFCARGRENESRIVTDKSSDKLSLVPSFGPSLHPGATWAPATPWTASPGATWAPAVPWTASPGKWSGRVHSSRNV